MSALPMRNLLMCGIVAGHPGRTPMPGLDPFLSGLRLGWVAMMVVVPGFTACSNSTIVPETELPHVGGTWELSIEASPVGTTGAEGRCELVAMTLVLEQSGQDLTGSHSGGELACAGITEHATQLSGISDTVFVFAAGTIIGSIGWGCYGGPGAPWGCPTTSGGTALVVLRFLGQELLGEVSPDRIRGDLGWQGRLGNGDEATLLHGTWQLIR